MYSILRGRVWVCSVAVSRVKLGSPEVGVGRLESLQLQRCRRRLRGRPRGKPEVGEALKEWPQLEKTLEKHGCIWLLHPVSPGYPQGSGILQEKMCLDPSGQHEEQVSTLQWL